MGKFNNAVALAVVLTLVTVVAFLIFHASRRQTMALFPIPNSSLRLEITKDLDGRLFCQLFENGRSISESHPLSSKVPFRHYKWFADKKIACDSNIVTVSWLAEDGWNGDPYCVVVDTSARRLIAGSNTWPIAVNITR